MTTQVSMQKKEPGMVESMIPGLIGLAGTVIGGAYGGAGGAAAGGMVGGQVGKSVADSGQSNVGAVPNQGAALDGSNPRDRHMASLQNDPNTQLAQGKAALGSLDEQDRVMLEPVLNEAMARAYSQNNRNRGQV